MTDTRTEWEKMVAGDLYRPGDAQLAAARARAQALMRDYNRTIVGEDDIRGPILDRLLGGRGPGCAIRTPFSVDYGVNIFLGRDVFFNYGCTVLDVCRVTIGDMTQIGPGVQIVAADHPREAEYRDAGLENGKPVTIGRNVWIGAQAVILPGVTVGDDAIIGAGAIVTRDVAPGATVVGNPARPLPHRA